jgi:hypothetical protein
MRAPGGKMNKSRKTEEKDAGRTTPEFDDVLKRMLSSPPQHKVKPKPAAKPAEKKKPAEAGSKGLTPKT